MGPSKRDAAWGLVVPGCLLQRAQLCHKRCLFQGKTIAHYLVDSDYWVVGASVGEGVCGEQLGSPRRLHTDSPAVIDLGRQWSYLWRLAHGRRERDWRETPLYCGVRTSCQMMQCAPTPTPIPVWFGEGWVGREEREVVPFAVPVFHPRRPSSNIFPAPIFGPALFTLAVRWGQAERGAHQCTRSVPAACRGESATREHVPAW
jgi:hypothetical protein